MKFDERTTELLALAASVAANCQACVEYHVGKATESGVSQDELAQVVEIGRMVRRGAAANVDKVADGLLQNEPASTGSRTPAASNASGCCGSAPRAETREPTGASTCVPNRWMPSSSMAAGCCSGEFPFRSPGDAKS